MKLFKPDYDRRLELPGVPAPVRRPVDIDQSQTGFANLRTLRIYQFDAESVINGHAEEDEVLIVVLSGRIELIVSGDNSGHNSQSFTLDESWVAYLPPHAAYQLISKTDADIAYARATPAGGRPSIVFKPSDSDNAGMTYAQRLRLRLIRIDANQQDVMFSPVNDWETKFEALVHIRTGAAEQVSIIALPDATPIPLDSWDTAAVAPGERPEMRISMGTSVLILIVMAI